MTTEEAIEYAEKKKLQLEEEIERPGSAYGAYAMHSTELEFVSMAISALRAQQSRGELLRRPGGIYMDKEGIYIPPVQSNAPLTLDELREMDGEPVWIVWHDGRIESKWWIVGNYDWRMMEFDEWRDYGKTWAAYRHKPEEGTI